MATEPGSVAGGRPDPPPNGAVYLDSSGAQRITDSGKLAIYRCVPKILDRKLVECRDDGTTDSWDLSPFNGPNVGQPCSAWKVVFVASGVDVTLAGINWVTGGGSLIGLPGHTKSLDWKFDDDGSCPDAFFVLVNGCIDSDTGEISWPNYTF